MCASPPVRADYLGAVVWDHITGLLADPALIRAEISKRLDQAHTSDPALRQRNRLETVLAKATKSITAMIEAYSGQLITIDEMRSRMPQLRAREAGLRAQLEAAHAQAADRDAYLKLAGDLEGFLAQLRSKTATASTGDRRRVLKLLVKDVLIGPEKITIFARLQADARRARGREGNRGTTLSPGRPAHTPNTSTLGKPLPGLATTLRLRPVPGTLPGIPRPLPHCRRRSGRSRRSARREARTNDLEVWRGDGHTRPRGRPPATDHR